MMDPLWSETCWSTFKYFVILILSTYDILCISWIITYLLTYLLTPWCRVLLEKLTGLQLVKIFPAFHGTRMFITALTSIRQLSVSWASPIQSIYPHPTSWRSVLILSTHLRLGLPSGLLPSGLPTKTLYTPLSSPICATWPAHLILLDFITRTILGEEYRSFSYSLCNLLHSPITSSLLGTNILQTIKRRKANWIGHILRRNCFLKHIIKWKINGRPEVTGRRGKRRKQLAKSIHSSACHTFDRRSLFPSWSG